MSDLTRELLEAVSSRLGPEGYDLVDVVPVKRPRGSANGAKVKFQPTEEALAAFDAGEDVISYVVHIKPTKKAGPAPQEKNETQSGDDIERRTRGQIDEVYMQDGKTNVPFLQRNAELLLVAGEPVLARNIFKAILKSGGHTASSLYGIGRTYETEGKMEEAAGAYEESIAFYPSAEVFRRFSAVLVGQGKDQYAGEILERALCIKDLTAKERFEFHKASGNCWTRVKDAVRAESHYRKALELDPSADGIQCSLGALYLQDNDFQNARRSFEDAGAANARNDKAWIGLGTCCYEQGEKRKAYAHFVRALTIDLNSPTAIYYLVKCAYEIKRYKEAEVLVRNYVDVAPINANLLYSLAGLQFHVGKLEAAEKTARRIQSMRPEHDGAKQLIKLIREKTAKTA